MSEPGLFICAVQNGGSKKTDSCGAVPMISSFYKPIRMFSQLTVSQVNSMVATEVAKQLRNTQKHVHVLVNTHTCMYMYMHASTHTHTHTHTHAHAHTHMHTQAHTNTHKHTHTHTHTHTLIVQYKSIIAIITNPCENLGKRKHPP